MKNDQANSGAERRSKMKRKFLLGAGVLMSALCAGNVLAANPTEVVIFSCMEPNPASSYTVLSYDKSASAPAKPSTDCSTTLETLLNDGLTNVNVSVQTYQSVYGAPSGVDGTYITYVLANGTLTSGGL